MSTELPTRKGTRLYQNIDVSTEARAPNDGDGLVFDKSRGLWVPQPIQVSIEPGDIPEGSISEIHLSDSAVSTRTIQGGAITSAKMAANSVGGTQLMDNSVTDAKVGNRTVTDAESMNTSSIYNTGGLTTLLSRLATKVKEIIGTSNWKSPVPISLTALANHKARHATGGADYVSPSSIGAAPATHSHSNATQAVAGFMSAADKLKMDQSGHYWHATNSAAVSLSPYATFESFISGMQINLDRQGTWLIHLTLYFTISGTSSDQWDISADIEVQSSGDSLASGHVIRPPRPSSPVTLNLTAIYEQTASAGYINVYAKNNYPLSAGGFTVTIPKSNINRIFATYLG